MLAKKIILGISGSIAAYKSLILTRLLIKEGCEVKVIMTPSACEFVGPISFATLSKNKVHVDIIDNDSWSDHVGLGIWSDAMIVAPATAATLSRMASGLSDNMLVATYLSAKCPVFIAPAMDLDMWKHPASQENIEKLQSFGNKIIPVGHGELASGLVGEGRMAEPEEIVSYLKDFLSPHYDFEGKKFLITAGPTREAIDPVRFISNNSTGTMGVELAKAASARGAHVTLVLGPTAVRCDDLAVEVVNVISAQDMYDACHAHHQRSDVVIFAAAVADYAPITKASKKIKKSDDDLGIPLVRTIDIAKSLGKNKRDGQVHVGFALETHDGLSNAKAKLEKKNFDLIVLNDLSDKGAGFGPKTNKVTIVDHQLNTRDFPLKPKSEVAHDVLDELISHL